MPKPNVGEADQSPMNARRWKCVLTCGHVQWHTGGRRPRHVRCVACGIAREAAKNASKNAP